MVYYRDIQTTTREQILTVLQPREDSKKSKNKFYIQFEVIFLISKKFLCIIKCLLQLLL